MNVNVTAVQQPDGSVKCKIDCDGQEANFFFSGGEVFVVIPEPGGTSVVSEGFPDEASPAGESTAGPEGERVTELHVDDADYATWQQDFSGLLFLGALRAWFDWCGHRIALRTLTTDEELLVAQLIREFEGGMGGMKAYATATAGLAVESIDHQPMPAPLGEHPNQTYKWALERFNYARRWFPPTIDAILDAYLQLESRQREVMSTLGKASAPEVGVTPGLSASSGLPSAGGS